MKIDAIRAECDAISDKLKFLKKKADNHATAALHQLAVEAYIKELDHWRNRMDELHASTHELNPADIDTDTKIYWEILENIRVCQHKLWDVKASFPVVTPTATTSTTGSTTQQNAKLPKLEIQPFYGDYLSWTTFKDTFEAAVHNRTTLPKVEKFSYLKTLLKGEASRYTQSLALTDANYDQAWQQLHDRYQNKRKITMAAIESFFSYQQSKGTSKSIKGLIDATNACLRAMELQGLTVANDGVEAIFVHQISSKLDSEAKNLWEHTLKDKEIPKLKELCEYLERHATALEESSTSRNGSIERRTSVHHTESRPRGTRCQTENCRLGCQTSHPLYRCRKFLDATIFGRREMAKDINSCFKCLAIDGHRSSNCPSTYQCRWCDANHNTLLHLEAEPRQGSRGLQEREQVLTTSTSQSRSE